jgi:anthranilate synthase component 1
MIEPGREEFLGLAADHDIVPVRLEVLGDRDTPVSVFEALAADHADAFLLESVEGGDTWARWSFVGWNALFSVVADDTGVRIEGDGPAPEAADPLDAVAEIVAGLRVHDDGALPPLHSGLVGYLGYDAVRHIEHLPNRPEDDRGLPTMVWHAVGSLAAIDRFGQTITLVRNVMPGADPGAAYDAAVAELESSVARLDAPPPKKRHVVGAPAGSPLVAAQSMDRDAYVAAVERAVEYIEAGDAFQIVPSIRFEVPVRTDPFSVYRMLRIVNPSPYMFFLRAAGATIAGSSPELMVRVRDGRVYSRPIAGTRRRGGTEGEDAALEAELLNDPKERAEHVMLVDLARNDVGRVAEYGSVRVDDLMVIERYSHVMHIVSGVSGDLRDGFGPVDVLRATFPHGTVSGAPKVRAMEIIDELEPVARGPYAGAVGYLDFSGNVDTAIALRTMVATSDTAWVQAGAGVVADSDPGREYEECVEKAAAVLAAIERAEGV